MQLNHDELIKLLQSVVGKDNGIEVHPFKIGWYNKVVSPAFKLPYSEECAGLLFMSSPHMFQNMFIPFLRSKYSDIDLDNFENAVQDPLDACMKDLAAKCCEVLQSCCTNPIVMHDFDLWPSKKPKILMPTAGHVSGAAYYYKWDVAPVDMRKNGIGVSLHSLFGGYFAFRFVIILDNCTFQDLVQKEPVKNLKSEKEIVKALSLFKEKWFENEWREVTEPKVKYSDEERIYFATMPKHRWKIIKQWLKN